MRQPPRNPLSERIQFNKNSLWPDTENLLGGYNLEKCDTYRNFRDLFLEMKNADIGITPQIKDFREHSTFLTILISPLGNRVASPKVVRSLPVSQTRQSIFMLMPIVPKKFDKLRLGGGHSESSESSVASGSECGFSGVLSNRLRYIACAKIICDGSQVQTTACKLEALIWRLFSGGVRAGRWGQRIVSAVSIT